MQERPHPYIHITSRCFVSIPFRRLQNDLQPVIDNRLRPEIGLDHDVLDSCSRQEFVEAAEALRKNRLACTLHAPFTGLAPGAADRSVLQATRDKLRRAFDLIPIFKPLSVVCHLNSEADQLRHLPDDWLSRSLATWRELIAVATSYRTLLMLENTYETEPTVHQRILTDLASAQARFCLDTGHVMAFAHTVWQDWLPAMQPWLGQLHLHDNHGSLDEHLAIGRGVFDFTGLFAFLKANRLQPLITLEPHEENELWTSLAALARLQYFPSEPGAE